MIGQNSINSFLDSVNLKLASSQDVSSSATSASALLSSSSDNSSATEKGDFDKILGELVKPNQSNEVSEEALFAGVVGQRIDYTKGSVAATQYKDLLGKKLQELQTSSGYIPYEKAAKLALRELRDSGTLTSSEADKIYTDSFRAAQLDSDLSALWDDRGGVNDPTKSVASLDVALKSAKDIVDKIDAGNLALELRSLNEAALSSAIISKSSSSGEINGRSTGLVVTPGDKSLKPRSQRFDGPGGFLFKPQSVHGGKLTVLVPPELAPLAKSVKLIDENGKTIEAGRIQHREGLQYPTKYNFKKSGAKYPKNITLEVSLNDGSVWKYHIPNPAKRYD